MIPTHQRDQAGTGEEASSWLTKYSADQVQWERGRESQVGINKHEETIGSGDSWILKGNRAERIWGKKACRVLSWRTWDIVVSP